MSSAARSRAARHPALHALRGLALTLGLMTSHAAMAQTCTPSFPALNFGSINVLAGTNFDIASTIVISCTGIPTGFRVRACMALNDGSVAPFNATWRQMASGANLLRFTDYRNAAYTQRWGNTVAQSQAITITSAAGSASRAIYARVQSGQQSTPVGTYLNNMDGVLTYVLYANGTTAPGCAAVVANPTAINFTVTATVIPSCSVTATNMNFGTVSVLAANVDATSQINVTCTHSAPYAIRLNGGLTGAVNPALRKMANGANQITYGLFRDGARALGWGSTDGVNTQNGTGNAAAQAHTVHGRIAPQASPQPGLYTDTIVVTVAF